MDGSLWNTLYNIALPVHNLRKIFISLAAGIKEECKVPVGNKTCLRIKRK